MPKTPLDIISDAIQANVALGLMALLIVLLMRSMAKSREEHREDMLRQEIAIDNFTSEVRKLREELTNLGKQFMAEIIESDSRLELLRYHLNKELIRQKRESVPAPPRRFPTRSNRETKKEQ